MTAPFCGQNANAQNYKAELGGLLLSDRLESARKGTTSKPLWLEVYIQKERGNIHQHQVMQLQTLSGILFSKETLCLGRLDKKLAHNKADIDRLGGWRR